MSFKIKALILSVGLLSSVNTFADLNSKIILKFNFTRFGKSICDTTQIVNHGDLNLLCEGTSGENRIFLKASTQITSESFILVSAVIEEVAPSGVVTTLSKTSIQTLVGKHAKVTQSDDSGELFTFGILTNFEN